MNNLKLAPVALGLVLLGCVIGSLLTACKKGPEDPSKTNSLPSASQAAAPQASAPPPPPPPVAAPAPAAKAVSMDFSIPLQAISSLVPNFSNYRGKPVLLFYFGPTCPHCQAAVPEIQAFADEIRPRGVETLGIANSRSNPQEIQEFIANYKVRFPVYWDSERKIGDAYNVESLPTLYLVGKEGDVFRLDNFSGKASLDILRAKI